MGDTGNGVQALSSIVSGGAGLANGASQAGSMRAQGRFQDNLAQQNAGIAQLQGQAALQAGQQEAAIQGQKGAAIIGAQRASMAAQGVDVNTGSAAQIQADTAGMSALDQMTIMNNAKRTAWGYQVQALNDSANGKMALNAARTNANSTLLTGGLQFAKGLTDAAGYFPKNKQGSNNQNSFQNWQTNGTVPTKKQFQSSDWD